LAISLMRSESITEAVPGTCMTTWFNETLSSRAWLAPNSILADHPGLDRAAADKLDDTRNNAGMWKVDLLDTLMGLGQHLALLQIDDREIRRQPRQRIGLETVNRKLCCDALISRRNHKKAPGLLRGLALHADIHPVSNRCS
jgi:hypothetical protein